MSATHYDILCVDRTADESEVRAAYRRLVKHYHPDIAGAAGVVMTQKLNEAMDVLTNAGQRRDYDAELDAETERPAPTAKPKRSKPAPAHPEPEPIPAADVWRPAQTDVSGPRRPHTRALGWTFAVGLLCWALFWVITLLRPDTDSAGFFQWAYPIVAGALTVLSIGRGVLSVPAWVNVTVIIVGPLWFLAHAPANLYLPVTEILGGIGSRSLYAQSVFAVGTLLISIAATSEVTWSAVVREGTLWTAFEDAAVTDGDRALWLVTAATSHGDSTVVDAVNEASGRTVRGMSLSGVCYSGQYILVDERYAVVAHASSAARTAHQRLVAALR